MVLMQGFLLRSLLKAPNMKLIDSDDCFGGHAIASGSTMTTTVVGITSGGGHSSSSSTSNYFEHSSSLVGELGKSCSTCSDGREKNTR